MDRRHQLWAIARLLVGRFGQRARHQAALYAVTAASRGDRDSQAIWKDVAGALGEETLRRRRQDLRSYE